jgi:arginyl-tRNA synthetase
MTPPARSSEQRSPRPPEGAPAAPLEELRGAVVSAAGELDGASGAAAPAASAPAPAGPDGAAPRRGTDVTLERPRQAQFGDYSTNAAMLLAPRLKASPREVAERLGGALAQQLGASLERYEVAGPGFLNLFLADSWLQSALVGVLGAGAGYGGGAAAGQAERILVEFVSANPTGPMHVGHARNAAYGDALARLLAFAGNEVSREFYVNDGGSQVRKLGESIVALAEGREVPEDGYRGEYVARLVGLVAAAGSADPGLVGGAAVAAMIEQMQATLAAFGVQEFDHWAYESALHEGSPSAVERTLSMLAEQGRTYEKDGALWLRTSDFGDDKDRVLVRSDGEYTYFASDIAYHEDKRERGFAHQIDVWGADHHGYTQRMKAVYEALGADPGELELLIMQLVHLLRGGSRAQMSKRAGEFVSLEDLLEDIGVDAARWYLLARSHDTTVDLDLDLAREQSSENPVYYVQYAHARICSMLERAGQERVRAALEELPALPAQRWHPSERELVHRLLAFPGELAEAAARRAVHRIPAYALALAQDFTAFYRDCRVIGAETSEAESLRIALSVAAARVIERSLALLGITAPHEM